MQNIENKAQTDKPQGDKQETAGQKASFFRKIYVLTTIGLQFVVSIFMGLALGLWLDSMLGTKPWLMLAFIIFGSAAGFVNMYRVAVRSIENGDNEN